MRKAIQSLCVLLMLTASLSAQVDSTTANEHAIVFGVPFNASTTDFSFSMSFISRDANWFDNSHLAFLADSTYNGSTTNVVGFRILATSSVLRVRLFAGGGTGTNCEISSPDGKIDEDVWNLLTFTYDGTDIVVYLNDETPVTCAHGAGGNMDDGQTVTCIGGAISTTCESLSLTNIVSDEGPFVYADDYVVSQAEHDQMYTMLQNNAGAYFWEYAPGFAAAATGAWSLDEGAIGAAASTVLARIGTTNGAWQSSSGTADYVSPRLGH